MALPEKPLAGSAFAIEDPPLWKGEPFEPADLLDEIARTLDRFIVLPAGVAEMMALWSAHTFALDAFDVTPILAIASPQKRCGKTSLVKIVNGLVRRPLAASGISPSALFRLIESHHPTLLVDEMDGASKNEELRTALNSGNTRTTARVVRTVGKDFEPRSFSTWAPRVLAYIGRMPSTIEDRSIRVTLKRKAPHEYRERIRTRELNAILAPLASKLMAWAGDPDNHTILRELHPAELPQELDDRAQDNWECLYAIAELAGGRWPARVRELSIMLSADRSDEDTGEDSGLLLLADLRALISAGALPVENGRPYSGISAETACERLKDLPERPWKTWGGNGDGLNSNHLARLLRPFQLTTAQTKVGNGLRNVRVYPIERLHDVFARYLRISQQPATAA